MQRSTRLACVLVLAAFLPVLIAASSDGAPTLHGLKNQWEETARSINYVRAKLRPLKQRQRSATHELAVAERRLETTRSSLRDTQSQLRSTRSKLEQTRAELERIEKRLKERNDLLAARLVYTYKHGSVSYLSILLGAADFWDLLNSGYVVRKVLQSDVELLEAIKEDKKAVEEHKAMLEEQERQRAELEQRQRGLTHQAHAQTKENARILKEITSDRAKYEQMLAALESESRSISAMIRKMQGPRQGRRQPSQVWKGGLIAPVNGRVTSDFGWRFHPILGGTRMHTGVDIAAPHGTTIRAAAGGEVMYTGWRGAFGNTVIIDHGGDLYTIYGHCSGFLVRAGATVKQGQPIARVGSTGLSTGPHVHFEVQKNGAPIDPF